LEKEKVRSESSLERIKASISSLLNEHFPRSLNFSWEWDEVTKELLRALDWTLPLQNMDQTIHLGLDIFEETKKITAQELQEAETRGLSGIALQLHILIKDHAHNGYWPMWLSSKLC
jgi:hypothetical protein